MPFMCTSSARKVGCGKGRPVEIIADNSVDTVVFENTDIPHPLFHIEAWQGHLIYIYIYLFTEFLSNFNNTNVNLFLEQELLTN